MITINIDGAIFLAESYPIPWVDLLLPNRQTKGYLFDYTTIQRGVSLCT